MSRNRDFSIVREQMIRGALRVLAPSGFAAEAEPLVHDRLAAKWADFEARMVQSPPAEDRGYYYTIGRNLAVDYLRALPKQSTKLAEDLVDDGSNPEAVLERIQHERDREALNLRADALVDGDPLLAVIAAYAVESGRFGEALYLRLAAESARANETSFLAYAGWLAGVTEKHVLKLLYPSQCTGSKAERNLLERAQKSRSRQLIALKVHPVSQAEEMCRSLQPAGGRVAFARIEDFRERFSPNEHVVLAGYAFGMSADALARVTKQTSAEIESIIQRGSAPTRDVAIA